MLTDLRNLLSNLLPRSIINYSELGKEFSGQSAANWLGSAKGGQLASSSDFSLEKIACPEN